jgi:SpoVK/Ycf46/Vps4 family AAA+-type ATPase
MISVNSAYLVNNKRSVKYPDRNLNNKYFEGVLTSEPVLSQYNYIGEVLPKEKLLEDYNVAGEFFNKNFDNKKPILGSIENLKLIESNYAIKRNLCKFLVEKSGSELKRLLMSPADSDEIQEKITGYIQINNFFKEYLELLPESEVKRTNPSFLGKLTKEDEKYCKNFVLGVAGACSLISAGAGAFSLGSADTVPLRCLQSLMFLKMHDYLKVPFIATAEYTAKELFSGAVIGTEGAKIFTDVFGWAAHGVSAASGASALSGGSSHAAIAGASSAIHGSLSFMITEKMGRGFIKRVKNNQMIFKNQTIELASYFGTRAIFGGLTDFADVFDIDGTGSVDNAFDKELIKDAYENISAEKKEILGALTELFRDFNASKLGISFTFNFATKCLVNISKIKDKDDLKNYAKQAFKDAFILTAIYDMFDFGIGEVVTNNAKETIQDIQQNLEQYPDVYKVFKDSEYEFWDSINIEKLGTNEFQKQFTNKTFLTNLSILTNEQVKEFVKTWRNRKDAIHKEQLEQINKKYNELSKDKERINNDSKNIDSTPAEEYLNEFKKRIMSNKEIMHHKNNFGYDRIAGYDNEKSIITQDFLMPILLEQGDSEIIPPSGILLYGPTNTGKTTLAQSVIEQALCKGIALKMFSNDEKITENLNKIEKDAAELFKTNNRRTILRIDEIESLNSKPKALAKLKEILDNEESRISLIGTTNSPEKINKDLIYDFIKIHLPSADVKNTKSILEHYLGNYKKNLDLDLLSLELCNNSNGLYSNKQLQELSNAIISNKLDNSSMPEVLKKVLPEISNEDIIKYNEWSKNG